MDDAHGGYPREENAEDLAPSPLYRTFVLRCWSEARAAPAWRFSLLEVGSTSPRRVFSRLTDLVAYLQGEMAATEAERRAGIDRLVEVFQRATRDAIYRQAFVANPSQVLAEAGLHVPEGIAYQVVENTADRTYIVLPPIVPEEEPGGEQP